MWSGRNTTVASNTFIGKGLMLGSDVTVAYNNFTGCDVAINMDGYNSTIRNNNFQNNQLVFHMYEGGCNQIYHNNFVSNIKQAEEQHSDPTRWPMTGYYTSVNNSWYQPLPVGGNYWSDYTGTDGNGDGFGDSPYHVIENYYDRYPIVQAANVVQPASENLLPSETAPTPTSTPSTTGNPPSGSTDNLPTNKETNQTNLSASVQQLLWVLVTLTIVIVLAILGAYHFYKRRKRPAKNPV
jgi:hypothetical protein